MTTEQDREKSYQAAFELLRAEIDDLDDRSSRVSQALEALVELHRRLRELVPIEQGLQSTTDVLVAARGRIATPAQWKQHRTKCDCRARARGGSAACCLLGALGAVTTDAASEAYRSAALFLAWAVGLNARRADGAWPFVALFQWSNAPGRTHAEVLAAFDKAIEDIRRMKEMC